MIIPRCDDGGFVIGLDELHQVDPMRPEHRPHRWGRRGLSGRQLDLEGRDESFSSH